MSINIRKLTTAITVLVAAAACTTEGEEIETAAEAIKIGNSNVDYLPAANEGSMFTLGVGGKYVAFGAGANWTYKFLAEGTHTCNIDTFGTDPVGGVVKACYFANMAFVRAEEYGSNTCPSGQICLPWLSGSSTQPVTYAFGANGNFRFLTVKDSKYRKCSVTTFGGDPASGVEKACYRLLNGYNYASAETSSKVLTGLNNTPVAFGANGKYAFAVKSGSSACNVATFGDPNPGVAKSCFIMSSGKSYVTSEGNSYYFNPAGVTCTMSYTSGRNGNVEQVTNCSGSCTNSFFNGDPDPGYSKSCYGAPQTIIY